MTLGINEINEMVKRESVFVESLLSEMRKIIVGQKYLLDRILIGLLAPGHVLLEGVPGLAKTLSVSSLAKCIDADFKRIQFTPDLLPADLIGTLIYNQKKSEFEPRKGPVFTNILLADEVNRAPAKVQSAMLEAMQEKQVTIGDSTYVLDEPFMVLATQNPIEQEGTYPLPEAQLDRFIMKLKVDYPSKAEERDIMDRMSVRMVPEVNRVVSLENILKARTAVENVYVDDKVRDYIVNLVFATRKPSVYGLELDHLIRYGASPRASIYLVTAARAHAFIRGRGYVTPEDVKSIGKDVLRHRVILSYEADAEELSSDDIIQQIFDGVEVP